jgi:hypothetical protein
MFCLLSAHHARLLEMRAASVQAAIWFPVARHATGWLC